MLRYNTVQLTSKFRQIAIHNGGTFNVYEHFQHSLEHVSR